MDYDEQRRYALKLFKGKKYKELRKAIRDGKCFSELAPIAEKAGAVEHWDEFIEEWLYHAGDKWSGITDEIRIKAFEKMKEDKWIFFASATWVGITDDMRIKVFKKMKDEKWIHEAFKKMKINEQIYRTNC